MRIKNLVFSLLPSYRFEIAIVQIRALRGHQPGDGEDDTTSQSLFGRILSDGPFRLVRMPGDRSTASQPGNNNSLSIEDNELGSRDGDEDDEDDEIAYSYRHRPCAKIPKWLQPVTAPQEAGLKLLRSGEFGRTGVEAQSRKGSASFAKAILSRQSKLRQTPKQDIANVRVMYVLDVSLIHKRRLSSRTPMVLLLRLSTKIYTVANTLRVRMCPYIVFVRFLTHRLDSSFYYTCCRGRRYSPLSMLVLKFC